MPMLFHLDGEVDAAVFQAGFQCLVDQSDCLRSTFGESDGIPFQTVSEQTNYDLEVIDLCSLDAVEFRSWVQERGKRCLDLSHSVFDSVLILRPQGSVWFLNIHHLATDASSTGVLYDRMRSIYSSLRKGEAVPENSSPAYHEYVAYEQAQQETGRYRKAAEHWRAQAAVTHQPVTFYGKSTAAVTSRSVRVDCSLEKDANARLRAIVDEPEFRSLNRDLALFNVTATILLAFLHRISGENDLRIGLPSHNRQAKRFADTAGLFIEMFPFHLSVADDETFRSLHRKVSSQFLELLRHTPPGSGALSQKRAPEVFLNFINLRLEDFAGIPTRTEWLGVDHADPAHAIRLLVHDFDASGEPTFSLDLNEDVFSPDLRGTAAEHFRKIAEAFLQDPQSKIGGLRLIEPNSPIPGEAAAENIVTLFRRQVSLHASHLAVCANGETLTYAELDQRSDVLGLDLQQRGVGNGDVVGVCLPRSLDAVVAIVGVLKSGAAFLPLDPSYPKERIRRMVDDAGAKLVLDEPITQATPVSSPDAHIDGNTRAYVIYTSGSTGRPKGCVIEHRQVLNLVSGLDERIYQPLIGELNREHLRVALLAPFVFDASVQQIFAALLKGHCLHLVPEADRLDGNRLANFLRRESIDVSDGTPAHLQLLVDGTSASRLEHGVSQFIIGGEALSRSLLERFFAKHSGKVPRVTNVYGTAECCVDSTAWEVTAENLEQFGQIPIGSPLPGSEILVLNSHDQIQPEGVIGELCIAGTGVGRGYVNDETRTNERFVENPFRPGTRMYRTGDLARWLPNGVLEFVGRNDSQVKIRGHRIELGEIESALTDFRIQSIQEQVDPPPTTTARCTKCLLTEQHPGVQLGGNGVCNVCSEFEIVQPRIADYFQPLAHLEDLVAGVQKKRAGEYDCLLLYSGGKDSSYVLYRLVEMGLRVLAYTFDNGYISQAAFKNIKRQTDKLGVDSVITSTEHMDEIFLESLNADNTVCDGCFKALTTISTRLAHERGIRMVVTGLSRGQIFDTKLGPLVREGIHEVPAIEEKLRVFRRAYHANQDRSARLLDDDLADVALDEIHFVDFFRYDNTPVTAIREYLSERDSYWSQPEDTGFCSSNCMMNDIGICVHSRNAGYHNYEAPLSWDIRLGIGNREEGLKEVEPVQDRQRVDKVLRKIGYYDQSIGRVAVLDHEDEAGNRFLCAYYVAGRALNVSSLRQHLSRTLPDYMIPARFVRVDDIPLTTNGKVDRKSLTPDHARPELSTAFASAEGEREKILARIWSEVLRVDEVGVHDNFFDLGGDSISAIQIVARAGEAGLHLTPTILFANQTIAELAEAVTEDVGVDAEQGLVTGAIPLTPIQHWFFEQNFPHPNQFSQFIEIELPQPVGASDLKRALDRLIVHHDALRTSFRQTEGEWTAEIVKKSTAWVTETDRDDLPSLLAEAHRNLDIGSGRLLGAISIVPSHKLLLVAHHLACDAMSWPILLADLHRLLEGSSLPSKTTSMKAWAEAMSAAVMESDVACWNHLVDRPEAEFRLPRDFENGDRSSTASLSSALSQDSTRALLEQRKRAKPNELILVALSKVLRQWTNARRFVITLEGHGREDLAPNLDLSRTAGWLTSRYPMCLELEEVPAEDHVAKIREQLESLPQHGLSFGMLRHLHPDQAVRELVRGQYEPELLFNYLGEAEAFISDYQLSRPLDLYRGDNPHSQPIEINVIIVGGVLRTHWTYDPGLHRESTIHSLAERMNAQLTALVSEGETEAVSERDFPRARLDKKKFNKLADALSKLK